MKIYKNEFNTLPMQVEENMKNIELLASIIKESYRSTTDLGDTATTIAIADTNANADTIDGWLISQDGYLYKITGGDGTNLLLEYYTRLSGKSGSEDIDDSITSLTKLWSSQKTSNEILGLIDDGNTLNNKTWSSDKILQTISYVKDKGIFATSTQPSVDGGGSYYTEEDLLNPSSPNPPRYSDLIIYIDGDGKTKYLYQITGVSGDGIRYYVTQIAEFGGGKKYYRHTLRLRREVTRWLSNVMLPQITTDDNTPFTLATLNQYLYKCGLIITSTVRQDQKYLGVEGTEYDKNNSSITTSYVGLGYFDTTHLRVFTLSGSGDILTNDTEWVLTDDVDEI